MCISICTRRRTVLSGAAQTIGKIQLEVAKEKTRQLRFSRFSLSLKNRYVFLGFEFYWDSDKQGKARLFRRTARERLQTAKQNATEYIRENRHKNTSWLIKSLVRKLRGHNQYFGVVGNLAALYAFKQHVTKQLHKWLNRRSGRKSYTWERLKQHLKYIPLPTPTCSVVVGKRVWW